MTPEGVTYDYVRPPLATTCGLVAVPPIHDTLAVMTCLPPVRDDRVANCTCAVQDAIVEWLNAKETDPSTNLPLTVDQLFPNRTVRSMIEDFIAKGPDFLTRH